MPPRESNKNSEGRAKAPVKSAQTQKTAVNKTVAPKTSPKTSRSTYSNKNVNPLDPMRGRPGVLPAPVIKMPVAGGKVSQQFGNVPSNPNIKYASGTNLGTDIAGERGSAISSIVGGKVLAINPNAGAWGNQVIIDAGNGRQLAYNHMDDFGDFKVGQEVKAGDILGTVGRTGQTTGAHLDLEATVNGASVPLSKAFPGHRFDTSWGGAEKGVAGAKAYNRAQNAFYDTSDLTKSTGSVYASGSGVGSGSGSGSSTNSGSSVNASSKPSGGFSSGQFVNHANMASTFSPTRGMRRPKPLLNKAITTPSSKSITTPSSSGANLGSPSTSPVGKTK